MFDGFIWFVILSDFTRVMILHPLGFNTFGLSITRCSFGVASDCGDGLLLNTFVSE